MTSGQLTLEEARNLVAGAFGEQLHRAVHPYVRPLWWLRSRDGRAEPCNGSTFFLDTGAGPFGVTAGHVYDHFGADASQGARCRILDSPWTLDLRERLISRGEAVDIATYRLTDVELRSLNAVVVSGASSQPAPPVERQGLMFTGFPGVAREAATERAHIDFGIYSALGIAASVSDRDVCCLLERHEWVPTQGIPEPEEEYDLGGMSGAPMFAIVQSELISWRLAGVIYEYSRDLAEIVTHADDRDVDLVTVDLRHPAHRALRDAALPDDAVDAGDHLGAVRKGNRARIEVLELTQPEVHWLRIVPARSDPPSASGLVGKRDDPA